MANPEHLAQLVKGADAWNQWRKKNLNALVPDLSGADLSRVDLSGADLIGANLYFANLRNTYLSGANLSQANLVGAVLSGTKLSGANLSKAIFGSTILGFLYLNDVKDLESTIHAGRSTVGVETLALSHGHIPEGFLRGCGLKDWEIASAQLYRPDVSSAKISEILYRVRHLRAEQPLQFHSCFISYSTRDQEFADRLYADLQNQGVRCWFALEDLKIGDKFRTCIDESIRVHDKLLLILSEHSLASAWVEDEVEAALERERRENRLVLFPIRLDDCIMETEVAWAAHLRQKRHIGDFRKWKDHDSYQKVLERLLRDLRQTEALESSSPSSEIG